MKNNGFTLVELAIALMVIGLLIGGVLKGQELIENARAVAMVRELKAYDTALMIFRNTYNSLPGDLRNAQNRIPDCTTVNFCVPTAGTQGDKILTSNEENAFWWQLRKAGLIGGAMSADDANKPETVLGGYYRLRSIVWPIWTPTSPHTNNPTGTFLVISPGNIGLNAYMVNFIDTKMDDGKPFTGDIQSTASNEFGGTYYNHDADSCTVTNTVNEHNIANRAALCTLNYGPSSLVMR